MRLTVILAGLLAMGVGACGGDQPVDGREPSRPASSGEDSPESEGADDEGAAPAKDGGTVVRKPDAGSTTPSKKDGSVAVAPGSDGGVVRGDAGDKPAERAPDAGEPVVTPPGTPGTSDKPQLAVSADFLNQTLTVFNVDKMVEGASRKDVLVGKVDLSKYSPGPVALNVTPDGKTALVSISASFLGAFIDIPPGDGTLLFVDLETLSVIGELNTGKSPMGIVITPDGKHAFVGQLSENYFSYVDIEKRTFEKLQTGAQWNEELAIDDSGTVGILTFGTAGNAKTFSIADPKMGGQTSGLTGDAGGTAFFPGT